MEEIAMPTIDIKKGIFAIGETLVIKPNSTFDEVLGFGLHHKVWDVGTGYRWIYFDIVVKDLHSRVNDLRFLVGACFFNAKIERIDFGFHKKYEKQATWDDWTEEGELEKKSIYGAWLKKTIGAASKHCRWGDVGAYYDERSAGSGIHIRYKNKEAELDYKRRMGKA